MFFIENECKTPYGFLTFTFYKKYFHDEMDLQIFSFRVTIYKLV